MSKLMESMAAEEDFEPNQDSSFSEDEHLPRGGAMERPLTPGTCLQWCVGSGLECGVQEVPLGKSHGLRWARVELAQGSGQQEGQCWGNGVCKGPEARCGVVPELN